MNENPPSKYSLLSRLAAVRTQRMLKEKALFEQIAVELRHALVGFLGAPADAISFRVLSENCDFAEPREFNDADPHLRRGRDNKWYFAICLHLQTDESPAYGKASFKFAAQPGDAGQQIVELDRKWTVKAGDLNSYESLVSYIYSDLESDCKKPPEAVTKRIGF